MTPKQQRTLDYVRHYFAEHGRGPTVRQINAFFSEKSGSSTHRRLTALTEYGFLRRTREKSGCYIPVEADRLKLQAVPTDALLAELRRRTDAEAIAQ